MLPFTRTWWQRGGSHNRALRCWHPAPGGPKGPAETIPFHAEPNWKYAALSWMENCSDLAGVILFANYPKQKKSELSA